MKKFLVALLLGGFAFNSFAQKQKTPQDSISVFYDKIFWAMESSYLYKDEVNWLELKSQVKSNLEQYKDFKSSLKEVETIFDYTKADHGQVYFNSIKYTGNFPGPTQKDFSEAWVEKFVSKPKFEVKVLDNQYGYILVPEINLMDDSSKNVHNIAQVMYDEIAKIKSDNNIKGWIIDLRFNLGGTCVPMLLGLYDFLGDNQIWGTLDLNKEWTNKVRLEKGKYFGDKKKISYIKPSGILLDQAKVALLINKGTASSGEVVALAFKERVNTIFIGEQTYGATTSNIKVSLPFNAVMALTIGFDGDRNGKFYKTITPDVEVLKKDNFDNLLADENVIEAIKFITDDK